MDRRKLIKEAPYPPFNADDFAPLLSDGRQEEVAPVWIKDTNRRVSKRERRNREAKSRSLQSTHHEYPYHPSSTSHSTYIQVKGSDDVSQGSPHYHPVSLYGAIGGGGARRYPRAAALRFFLFSIGALFVIIVMYAPYKQTRSRHDLVNPGETTSQHVNFIISTATQRIIVKPIRKIEQLPQHEYNQRLNMLLEKKFPLLKSFRRVYRKKENQTASVVGWSYNTSRDTRYYVLPDNVTVLHQPRSVCRPHDKPGNFKRFGKQHSVPYDEIGLKGTRDNEAFFKKSNSYEKQIYSSSDINKDIPSFDKATVKRNKSLESPVADDGEIFLLVIVCSSMNHFAARAAIRETWGNQSNYELLAEAFQNVTKRFAKLNATDKLLEDDDYNNHSFISFFSFDRRFKRDLTNVSEYSDDDAEVEFKNELNSTSDGHFSLYNNDLNKNISEMEEGDDISEGNTRRFGLQESISKNGSDHEEDENAFKFSEEAEDTEDSSNFNEILSESNDSSKNDKISNEEIISSMFDRIRTLEKLDIIENFKMLEYKERHKRDADDVSLDDAIADNKYVQRKMQKDGQNVQEPADDPRFDNVGKKEEDLNEDENILGNFEGNEVDQNDEVFEEYDYQTEVSNIMRIPPRGEKLDSDSMDSVKSVVDTAKDLLKLSIKDNKLNLMVEHSKDNSVNNNVEFKPSNSNDKLRKRNKIDDKKPKSSVDTFDLDKESTNRFAKDNYGDKSAKSVKKSNIYDPEVHENSKIKQKSKYLHGNDEDEKNGVSPTDEIIYGETTEFVPPVKTKFLFLLGRSATENDTDVQLRIDEEAAQYGDVIQEGFVDSYNNLTLKSVMLLKWVVGNCGGKVRYVMKTDDDMFVNIPRLVDALKNKSAEYNKRLERHRSLVMMTSGKLKKKPVTVSDSKEILLMGDLICDARPISDTTSKWYSPTYMFGGKVYPRYLSGTSYVMSMETAKMLYNVALETALFHLEDIYITGICSRKAGIRPIDHPGFSYTVRKPDPCAYWRAVTSHQVPPHQLKSMQTSLLDQKVLTKCEVRRIKESRRVQSPTVITAAKSNTKKVSRCL